MVTPAEPRPLRPAAEQAYADELADHDATSNASLAEPVADDSSLDVPPSNGITGPRGGGGALNALVLLPLALLVFASARRRMRDERGVPAATR